MIDSKLLEAAEITPEWIEKNFLKPINDTGIRFAVAVGLKGANRIGGRGGGFNTAWAIYGAKGKPICVINS